MILDYMEVEGWRQFRDLTRIDFVSGERPLTIVHGENSGGKTALLNALYWCITGETTPRLDKTKNLFYHTPSGGDSGKCKVTLSFEHEGVDYHAIRTLDAKVKGSIFKLFAVKDGHLKPIEPSPELTMDRILPKGMAKYFFFDGEGFHRTKGKGNGSSFKDSIKTMLGFDFAEEAIDLLKQLKKAKNAEIEKHRSELMDSESEQKEYREAIDVRDQIDDALKKAQGEKRQFEDLIEQANSLIKELDDPEAKRAQIELERCEREIKRLRGEELELVSQQNSLISKHAVALFGKKLFDFGGEIIDKHREVGKLPADYSDTFIRDLLAKGVCMCGRDLDEGHEEKLRSMISKATNRLIDRRLTKAHIDPIREYEAAVKGFQTDYQSYLNQLSRVRDQLQEQLKLRDEWKGKQRDIDEEKLNSLRKRRDGAEDQVEVLTKEIIKYELLLEEARNRIGRLESGNSSKRDESVRNRIDVLRGVVAKYDRLIIVGDDFMKKKLAETSMELARNINMSLEKYLAVPHRAKVTPDYDYYFVGADGKPTATGGGAELLLNLTFIAELVRLARRRVDSDAGGLLVPGTIAPLTIDAPFGEMDVHYQPAAAEILLSASNQITFLLSSSHWRAIEKTIEAKIGKEYVIFANNPDKPGAKPSHAITIDGKEHHQRVYDDGDVERSWLVDVEEL